MVSFNGQDLTQGWKPTDWVTDMAVPAGYVYVTGYLIDQFNNTVSNKRQDNYGGSFQNRACFALETAAKVAEAIGPEHTAIRLSPYGVFNGMEHFPEKEKQFIYLAQELGKLKLVYLHVVDHTSLGAPEVPQSIKDAMRTAFKGTFIPSGYFDK